MKNIWKRLVFNFFNGSLLHGPKGLRSRLYDGVRLQGPSYRSSFCFKVGISRPEASLNLHSKTLDKYHKLSSLKFCHWNLNGLAAYEFIKLSLLESYINVNDIDIICLLKTFLDSSLPIDDNSLSIPGYSMIKVDHPSNTKRGRICLYYKEHLPIIRRDDISNLKECLITESP